MSSGLLNIDAFLPTSWSTDYGLRAFQFDAFVSHNHDDRHSRRLVDELISRGVQVWYDNNQDLSDQRVRESVARALYQSRFVIVSMDAEFRDSEWCRAEYLPAIEVETPATATRVLVAKQTEHVNCPARLEQAQAFLCYERPELDRLAKFVQEGNRAPFDQAILNLPIQEVMPYDELRQLAEKIVEAYEGRTDEHAMAVLFPAYIVLAREKNRHPQHPMAGRQVLQRAANLEEFSAAEYSFLFAAAHYLAQFSNSDDRANGLMMAMSLSEPASKADLREPVIRRLAVEADWNLQIAFPWFARLWPTLTPSQREMVELCALRDPLHVRNHRELVQSFAEVTRVKVYVRGLEPEMLSIEERLKLIERRVDYVLHQNIAIDGREPFDAVRHFLRISDLEIIFRDLDALIFASDVPRPEAAGLAPRIVAMIARVGNVSASNGGAPLTGMDDWIIDYVLIPLIWCCFVPQAAVDARKAFAEICDTMEQHSKHAKEVPAYRKMLEGTKEFRSKDDVHRTCY